MGAAYEQIGSASFDAMQVLKELSRFERVPEGIQKDLSNRLYKVMYACIPPTDYDVKNVYLLQLHTQVIATLQKFVKNSLVLAQFDPDEEELEKLQLTKLIRTPERSAYLAGVEFASFMMRNCRVVLPIDLVEGDEHCHAIVQRHNELE